MGCLVQSHSQKFPPEKITDLSRESASNYLSLIKSCKKNGSITLLLGAGVSSSAGLPGWEKLLEKICGSFFEHWIYLSETNKNQDIIPPQNMSIAMAYEYMWSNEAKDYAKRILTDDKLLVAQQIKNCLNERDWRWLLRRSLYDNDDEETHDGSSSPLIDILAEYCKSQYFKVNAAINYNYDDLFERQLQRINVPNKPVFDYSVSLNNSYLPIYHPHGYLPIGGGPENTNFILAEGDYQQNNMESYSWSNLIQLNHLSLFPCLFIGLSLQDPFIRKILSIARSTRVTNHYAFLPKSVHNTKFDKMYDSLFDKELRRLGVYVIRYDKSGSGKASHYRLVELLDLVLKSADDISLLWEK